MNTIDIILENANLTREEIIGYIRIGINNGCGGKGGFNFSNFFEKFLHLFKGFRKLNNFFEDLKIVCGIHDIETFRGRTFKDFITVNCRLGNNIIALLYWSRKINLSKNKLVEVIKVILSYILSLVLWILVFGGTTLFGWKYFKNKTF